MIAHVITWIVSLFKDWDLVIDYYFTLFVFMHFYLVAGGRRQQPPLRKI
jgi:hypothetical protein